MKITTKIAVGYAALVVLICALSAWQLILTGRLLAAIERISGADFQAVTRALQLMNDRDQVDSRTTRFFLTGSPEDAAKLKDATSDFETTLQQIRSGGHSAREQTEIDRLSQFWSGFSANLASAQQMRQSSAQVPSALEESLDQLRSQAQTIYQISKDAISSGIEPYRNLARRTKAVILSVTALVLVLSVLAAILIIRSVSVPLKSLQQGTRGLAEGKSFYRLDTSRNDELSYLAKDFNTLAQKLRELEEKDKPPGKQSPIAE